MATLVLPVRSRRDEAPCCPVKRIKVVTLTATAPITEKIVCQVADGMAI